MRVLVLREDFAMVSCFGLLGSSSVRMEADGVGVCLALCAGIDAT